MKCPECGSKKEFRATYWELSKVTADIEIAKDGELKDVTDTHEEEIQDRQFYRDSEIKCRKCGYEGMVDEFDDEKMPFEQKDPDQYYAESWHGHQLE